MTRRRAIVVGGIGLLAIGAAWALGAGPLRGALSSSGAVAGDASPSPAAAITTATVERRTLLISDTFSGSLGYDGSAVVLGGMAGTITSLPAPGSVISRGQRLYEVDGGRGPYLLYGTRPAWRTLAPGSANGADIRQLEQNLKVMGMASRKMRVDAHWDWRTTLAVKNWQHATRQVRDGVVDLGEVVFLPSAFRVTELPQLGTATGPGGSVLTGTTATQVVTVQLPADQQALLTLGAAVSVDLPDGSTTAAHVTRIGRVASALPDSGGQPGTPTIPLTIALDDDAAAGLLDEAPVSVHVVSESRPDVLAVPVNALVSLIEGGYAVEVQTADGSHHYVAVHLGVFQDAWVEVVAPGLNAGDHVVVPS